MAACANELQGFASDACRYLLFPSLQGVRSPSACLIAEQLELLRANNIHSSQTHGTISASILLLRVYFWYLSSPGSWNSGAFAISCHPISTFITLLDSVPCPLVEMRSSLLEAEETQTWNPSVVA